MNNLKSILIIANSESVHSARFANEFAQRGFKVSLLSSTPYLGRVVNYDKSVNHLIFGATITNFFKLLFKKKMEEFNPANSSKLHPFNFLILFRMIYLFVFINRIVKNVDFEAVFCTNLTTNGLFAVRIKRNVNKICQTLGCDMRPFKWNSVNIINNNRLVYRFVEERLSYIIVEDEPYFNNFFSNRKTFKHPNKISKIKGLGVKINLFNPRFKSIELKKELYNLKEEDILAVCFRQPRPQFAFPLILNLLKDTIIKHPNFYFAIGTGGVSFPELIEVVKKNNMEKNILFIQNIPYDFLHKYIAQGDIFIDPVNIKSNPEMGAHGISGSVLESMSCGLIPVIMRRDGLDDFFDDDLQKFIYEDMDTNFNFHIENAISNINNIDLKNKLRNSIIGNSNWDKNIKTCISLFQMKKNN